MSNEMSNRPSLEMLEMITAIRAVLTVAKAIQERLPKATVEDIADAVDGAITLKLAKLKVKGYSTLSVAQKAGYKALTDAQQIIPQVQSILLQARDRTPEEIAEFEVNRESKLEKAKDSRAKTAAKKAGQKLAEAQTLKAQADMFADEDAEVDLG